MSYQDREHYTSLTEEPASPESIDEQIRAAKRFRIYGCLLIADYGDLTGKRSFKSFPRLEPGTITLPSVDYSTDLGKGTAVLDSDYTEDNSSKSNWPNANVRITSLSITLNTNNNVDKISVDYDSSEQPIPIGLPSVERLNMACDILKVMRAEYERRGLQINSTS